MDPTLLSKYFETMHDLALRAEFTDAAGDDFEGHEAVDWAVRAARKAHDGGGTLMFVGNGGSAGISSHMAIDYAKNGGLRATAFNDGAALTCLANDLGYDQVFAKQVDIHGRPGDMLIAISSSGSSANILNAAKLARARDITVFTLSGFSPDNPLRELGHMNGYVPSDQYGFVEMVHYVLLHAIVDLHMDWDGRVRGHGPLLPK